MQQSLRFAENAEVEMEGPVEECHSEICESLAWTSQEELRPWCARVIVDRQILCFPSVILLFLVPNAKVT